MLSFGWLVLIVGIMLSVFQQFVGINAVLYYAPHMFQNMGASTDQALWETAKRIATPEFNTTMPGQLKHLVDWGSRPYGPGAALYGKPIAVIGASQTDSPLAVPSSVPFSFTERFPPTARNSIS